MEVKTIILDESRNVKMTAIIQKVGGEFIRIAKRPAMLVLPGGGYQMCSDLEAEPVAIAFAKAGYQAFVLRYSVGEYSKWPNPLNDYENAMELIKATADEWGVYPNKVAVAGFSAGAHLAACAATIAKNKPAAALLGYGVYSGEISEMLQPGMPGPLDSVNDDTCPCFLFATRDDIMAPVSETIQFGLQLAKQKTTFESHIYAYGMHGFSTGESAIPIGRTCSRCKNWVDDSVEFLKDVMGDIGNNILTVPRYGTKTNDDGAVFLSVDCTVPHLMKYQESLKAHPILSPVVQQLNDMMLSGQVGLGIQWLSVNIRLRDILIYLQMPDSSIDEIDSALKKIPQ